MQNYLLMVANVRDYCKHAVARIPKDIVILGVLMLSVSLSFGLGYMAGKETGQGTRVAVDKHYIYPTVDITDEAQTALEKSEKSGMVIASRNGTRYYLPHCSGAKRIAEKNKVYFASAAAARAAGYLPAVHCEGI